ncbi:MAG: protein-disulfide isomerase [Bradymonadia bacterium]|jgi:protein-disulfide isomerase
MNRNFALLLAATVVLIAAGCTRNADAGTESSADELAVNVEAQVSAETATVPAGERTAEPTEQVAQADEGPSATRYPGLLFELLDATERTRFVGLAEAEFCPCEGAMTSLDACLKDEDICELGLQVGALMMRLVKESAQDVEITDGLQQFVQNARRVWEFELADAPCIGAEEPTITLVNFSDFECPHCREFTHSLDAVVEAHPDQVRVCYKQFPLGSHPNASAAAIAALAAHAQGRFIEYHDLVFAHQAALSAAEDPTALLVSMANEAGLNIERFIETANSEALQGQVERDRAEGIASGLTSTPTCFFNGVKMMGGYTTEELTAAVDVALTQ